MKKQGTGDKASKNGSGKTDSNNKNTENGEKTDKKTENSQNSEKNPSPEEIKLQELKARAIAVSLPETATEEEIVAAEDRKKLVARAIAAGLPETATEEEIVTAETKPLFEEEKKVGIPHVLTKEDMLNNPEFGDDGMEEGQTVYLSEEEVSALTKGKRPRGEARFPYELLEEDLVNFPELRDAGGIAGGTIFATEKEIAAMLAMHKKEEAADTKKEEKVLTVHETGETLENGNAKMKPTPSFDLQKFGKNIETILTNHLVGSSHNPMTEKDVKSFISQSGGKGISVSFKYHDNTEEDRKKDSRYAKICLSAFGENFVFPSDENSYLPIGADFSIPLHKR